MVFAESGDAKVLTRDVSLSINTLCSAGPQRKFPTTAPVVDCTFGTPPVRSISLTTTAGEADGVESAILSSSVKNYMNHNTISQHTIIYN